MENEGYNIIVSTRKHRVLKVKNGGEAMELSSRKQAVLSAIVKAYIETGEPIGSKILMGLMENAPSSATLRNEMNELCSLGLLSQPHTSAGRIPTSLGYKLYVDDLLSIGLLPNRTKDYINTLLSSTGNEAQNIPIIAADALSELTGYPAISCYIVEPTVYLKQVQLLPVSRKTAILLTVFSDGRTASRVCHISGGITSDISEDFTKLVKEKLLRRPLSELDRAKLQSVIAACGINSLSLMPLVTMLFEMVQSAAESTVNISGAPALYNFCSDSETHKIMTLCNRPDVAIGVLESGNGSDVIFGNDTSLPEFGGKVIVSAKYYCGDRYCGTVGIIGPDRMFYEQIIPSVKYIAERLTKLITKAVNDMEE